MLGKIIILLFLIAAMAFGGVLWFDYLNVIDARTFLAPVYRLIGLQGRTQPAVDPDTMLNLNDERFAILVEALDLQRMEIDNREIDLRNRHSEILQMAQELEERQKALEDQQLSINALLSEADIRDRSIEQTARDLTGMPPQRAVGILEAMDDQLVIDVLRKTEEIAQAEDAASIVPFWLSLMPPERTAEIIRKMAARPPGL